MTPVEGEDREPVSMLYVADSDELAIVDDINERIMLTNEAGQPTRTLPLEIDIDGFVVDAVMIDGYHLLYAEIGNLDGYSAAVGHLVDLSSGSTRATAPMPIAGRPGSGQLHVDRTSHIVYFRFGDLWYPFLDLDRFELLVDQPATTGWTGRVSDDRFIGVESGHDYLFTTFPTSFPSVMQIETTSTTVFVLASYTTLGTGQDGALLARLPLDGSQTAITLVPLPRLWESSRTFALRPADIVLMVKTDEGLALYSAPIT